MKRCSICGKHGNMRKYEREDVISKIKKIDRKNKLGLFLIIACANRGRRQYEICKECRWKYGFIDRRRHEARGREISDGLLRDWREED